MRTIQAAMANDNTLMIELNKDPVIITLLSKAIPATAVVKLSNDQRTMEMPWGKVVTAPNKEAFVNVWDCFYVSDDHMDAINDTVILGHAIECLVELDDVITWTADDITLFTKPWGAFEAVKRFYKYADLQADPEIYLDGVNFIRKEIMAMIENAGKEKCHWLSRAFTSNTQFTTSWVMGTEFVNLFIVQRLLGSDRPFMDVHYTDGERLNLGMAEALKYLSTANNDHKLIALRVNHDFYLEMTKSDALTYKGNVAPDLWMSYIAK